MNSVLITGADTPLGHCLIRRLLEDADVRHILAVGIEPDPTGLPVNPRVSYASTDLTRPRSVSELLFGRVAQLGIDTVVHAAHHRSARTTSRDSRALHVDGTHELLLQAEKHPTIERFVYRSFSDVYRIDHREPNLLDEDCPLTLGAGTPPLVLDRVAADVDVCTRMGMSRLHLVVLRCAEVLARNSGSQLWDYLQSRVCMRPLGFNPMINLLSLEDAGRALMLAMRTDEQGVFNIPGADTLPLSRLIRSWNRRDVRVPGPLLTPLYRLRSATVGLEFRYDLNMRRFHFGGLLDGARARERLGYVPHHPVPEIARGRNVAKGDRHE